MSDSLLPLGALEVSNQCVVVCDLRTWTDADSASWQMLRGDQNEVGERLAAALRATGTSRIEDFGGVCKTFLCDGDAYREQPPRIDGSAAVFSFTPKNRLRAEGLDMARVTKAAGYTLLILTLQKHEKFGKVWVLCGVLRHLIDANLLFYEDTNAVVDELKSAPEGSRVTVVHVQAPGYEDRIAVHADRVVSQAEYQREVLATR